MASNKIPTAYFREQKQYYSFDSFKRELNIDDNSLVEEIIERLRYRKLIKPTTYEKFNSAAVDEDFEDEINIGKIAPGSSNGFTFDFVGVAYTKNCILKCYPKYIDDDCSQSDFDEKYKEHFKTVVRAIKKYNEEKQQRVQFYNGEIKSENFNRLSVMLYILNDYLENGVYTNQKTIIETNGEGEIDWDRTINETFALIKNNQPYYFDLQTINTVNNDEDFIKLVHECIVSDCSRELQDTGILDMFDLSGEEITSMTLNDLGDKEFIKYKLENELKSQFITKKQNLLKTLYAYVNESQNGFDDSEFSFYGVHKFAPVWEKACGTIFSNQKNDYKIDSARWHLNNKEYFPKETLIPDIISVDSETKTFSILDAKYYLIECSGDSINNQPGTQDLVKQFAYNKTLYEEIWADGFEKIINAFLIPRKTSKKNKDDDFKVLGSVKYNPIQNINTDILTDIKIIELSPEFVFKSYLSGTLCTEQLAKVETTPVKQDVYQLNHAIQVRAGEYQKPTGNTVVGYLKSDYFKEIVETENPFYFYFYQRKDWIIYPLHDDLPFCNKFIGLEQQEDKTKMISGTITGGLHILSKDEMCKKVEESKYNSLPRSALFYYSFKVENIEIKDYDPAIEEAVNNYPGNNILHKSSPKVIQ